MTKKSFTQEYHSKLVENLYNQVPAFTDIFTEETFYMFAFVFVVSSILIACILSRFITLRPLD